MSATFFGLDPEALETKEENEPKKKELKELMRSPLFLKPLAVSCIMYVIQQVTGITARVSTNSKNNNFSPEIHGKFETPFKTRTCKMKTVRASLLHCLLFVHPT